MPPSPSFKKDLFAHFARIAKVLGHGNRLELLELLRGRGYAVRRMVEGYPEWKLAGFPVVAA